MKFFKSAWNIFLVSIILALVSTNIRTDSGITEETLRATFFVVLRAIFLDIFWAFTSFTLRSFSFLLNISFCLRRRSLSAESD
jgi:hypothetical protein